MLGAYSLDLNEIDSSLIRQSKKEVFGVRSRKTNLSLTAYLVPFSILALLPLWYFLYDAPQDKIEARLDASTPLTSQTNTSNTQKQSVSSPTEYRSWLSYQQDQRVTDGANSRSLAFAELYSLWGHSYRNESSIPPCEFANGLNLKCLEATGTWNDISNLNTPVVLELWLNFDKPQYALLEEETESGYSLVIHGEKLRINKTDLNNAWFGSYETLWKPPPNYKAPLALGDRHPSIAWLKKTLAASYDYSFDAIQASLYNQKLLVIHRGIPETTGIDGRRRDRPINLDQAITISKCLFSNTKIKIMTFILKAKNKSQGIKHESSSSGIKNQRIFATAFFVCLLALSAGLLIFNESKITQASQPQDPVEKTQEITKSNISKKSTAFNPKFENAQAELDRSSTIDGNETFLSDIARKVTSHIYTENPADRSIFIEGKAYEIGDRYESIEIRDISEEGITIRMINSGPDSKDLTLSLVENWLQQSGKN